MAVKAVCVCLGVCECTCVKASMPARALNLKIPKIYRIPICIADIIETIKMFVMLEEGLVTNLKNSNYSNYE